MTPIEIFEYKQKWKPSGYNVRLHSDLKSKGVEYCKIQMMAHQWHFTEYTDVYEHTFSFENKLDANSFAAQWPKYINQEN